MKKTVSSVLLAVLMLLAIIAIAPTSIIAQNKKTSKNPIKLEDLTQEILEIPQDLSNDKVKFFDFKAKNLSDVSINLYDASKMQTALISLRAKSQDVTEYEIQSKGKKEFVQIKKSENEGKISFEIISSNGIVSKTVMQLSSDKQSCESVKKILSVSIESENNLESFSTNPEINSANESDPPADFVFCGGLC